MKAYVTPTISVHLMEVELFSISDAGPGATDIGAPSVSNECKSVWDEVNEQLNHKEESYED